MKGQNIMKTNNSTRKLHKYICLELKHQRTLKNLKQDRVAFELGFSPAYLSNLENGKRETTSLLTYLKISDYYNIDFNIIVKNAIEKLKLDENAEM